MELGQKIRHARMEAGLSQRQLCGDGITRNMLSQIENGSAQPSLPTLRYLAHRLDKSISYFLEEEALTSPNLTCMKDAREALSSGNPAAARKHLETYRSPDPVFDQEQQLLLARICMDMAKLAIREGRMPYAAQLLEEAANTHSIYHTPAMEARRILLLWQTGREDPAVLSRALPDLDAVLLLKAEAALDSGNTARCRCLLDAAEDPSAPLWNFLRGEAAYLEKDYITAVPFFENAEVSLPQKVLAKLEICYRELGNFQKAYEYALKQR